MVLFLSTLLQMLIFLELELIPFGATLLACLFLGLEYGILVGLGTNIAFVLYSSARPPLYVERLKLSDGDIFLVAPSRSLQYPAAEFIREKIMSDCYGTNNVIVVDGKYVRSIDATVGRVSWYFLSHTYKSQR